MFEHLLFQPHSASTHRLLSLDPEELVATLFRSEDVTERTRVRHVTSDERDAMHRMLVYRVLKIESESETTNEWLTTVVLTMEASSTILIPSSDTWMMIFCLCSPRANTASFCRCSTSWHIRSPRGSGTSSTPMILARKLTPFLKRSCLFSGSCGPPAT